MSKTLTIVFSFLGLLMGVLFWIVDEACAPPGSPPLGIWIIGISIFFLVYGCCRREKKSPSSPPPLPGSQPPDDKPRDN